MCIVVSFVLKGARDVQWFLLLWELSQRQKSKHCSSGLVLLLVIDGQHPRVLQVLEPGTFLTVQMSQ